MIKPVSIAAALLIVAGHAFAQVTSTAGTDTPVVAPPTTENQAGSNPANEEVDLKNPEAKKSADEFKKLPKEKQEHFFKLLREGQEMLSQRRITESLEKFNEAETLWPLHPNLLNLKGSALVNIRDFERASIYFERASKLYPKFWQTHFNLSEMNFVGQKWAEAEKMFKQLLAFEQPIEGSTRRLVEYKLIICAIKQKRFDEAKKLIAQYDIYDDTPIFYYATAALNFELDNRKEAEEWVNNARSVYSTQINAIFEDSLTELGWLFVF